jgi:hypothetical protein
MARSIRNEREAHAALAHTARQMAQTRDDWRAVLARRDARRVQRRAVRMAKSCAWNVMTFAAVFCAAAPMFALCYWA